MDPANLLGALVRGALIGKPRKRSTKALRYLTGGGRGGGLVNASTMLAAAGVAWGLFETWQNSQNSQAGQAASAPAQTPVPALSTQPSGPAEPPPLPGVSGAPPTSAVQADVPPAVLRLVRLTVSAARADGALGHEEREAILAQATSVGAGAFVLTELDRQTPLSEIVRGVVEPREREALYALAFSIVRADESVSGAERIYLAQLAAHLGLEPSATTRIEQETARDIDAQADAD